MVREAERVAVIRPSRYDDTPALREIERRAGERFRDVGLAEIADDEPASAHELDTYAASGRSWVAVDEMDRPIGYVIVDVVDECAHISQVSVHPDHQGTGAGRALVDQVKAWALQGGLAAVTLTTFRDVPWNAPLYMHLGFRVLRDDELGLELRRVRAEEAAQGLDPALRVCMRADVRG